MPAYAANRPAMRKMTESPTGPGPVSDAALSRLLHSSGNRNGSADTAPPAKAGFRYPQHWRPEDRSPRHPDAYQREQFFDIQRLRHIVAGARFDAALLVI